MRVARWSIVALSAMLTVAPALTVPDRSLEERIEDVLDAVARADEAAFNRGLEELRGTDRRQVIVQLAILQSRSTSTEESMGAAVLLDRLAFTADEKIDAVLSHLDAAEPALRRALTEILGTVDRRPDGAPDFRVYEERLRLGGDEAPTLIRYL